MEPFLKIKVGIRKSKIFERFLQPDLARIVVNWFGRISVSKAG